MSSGADVSRTKLDNVKPCVLVELALSKPQNVGDSSAADPVTYSGRGVDSVTRLHSDSRLEFACERTEDLIEADRSGTGQLPFPMSPKCFEFGPFRLFPVERRLFRNETPIEIGSRALDILVLLSEHAGGVVAKHSIVETVWPGINVEESSLRVQIAKLRKALGEGQDGARYIANIAGRGYSLVAAVARSRSLQSHDPQAFSHSGVQTLPRTVKPVGREQDIAKIKALVNSSGFVTVHGFGGIGKTTVAVTVAEELVRDFEDGLVYLDLGCINSSDAMESTLARALGTAVEEGNQRSAIYDALGNKHLLLIIDNCEHLLDAATELVEEIRHRFPQLTFLVTTPEHLRAEGEHVYPLPPLEIPPDVNAVSPDEIMRYPSAQLFIERAVAAGYELEHSDKEARYVAKICEKLEGIPLALELVASRLVVHGIEETDVLCAGMFALAWQGRRTAVPRQQTLMSSLDWGYRLLSETEKAVLRRLSAFSGIFTLAEMQTACVDDVGVKRDECIDAFGQLVAKSFVLGGRDGKFRIYRIARAYAWRKLLEAAEVESVIERLNQFGYRSTRDSSSERTVTRATRAVHPPLYGVIDSHFGEMPGW